MKVESVNQNGRELFVRSFANVRDKPPTLPDGDLTGGRTVPESRRGARDGHLVAGQHRGTELSSMRRRRQWVERVSVHFQTPKLGLTKSTARLEPSNRGAQLRPLLGCALVSEGFQH